MSRLARCCRLVQRFAVPVLALLLVFIILAPMLYDGDDRLGIASIIMGFHLHTNHIIIAVFILLLFVVAGLPSG